MAKESIKKVAEEATKKVETVKADASQKVAAAKVDAKKEAEKVTKKATAKATEAKKTVKKATAKVAAKAGESKAKVILQYQNCEVDVKDVEERVKAQFISEGHTASSIKSVHIYLKPEEFAAYYVINEKFSGRVDLF